MPRRNGAERPQIATSPAHLEYTTHMRGVDVIDHLRSSYSCQTRTHKWWHRVLWFLVDTTVVIYLDIWKKKPKGNQPMTHLQFRSELCKSLTQNYEGRNTMGALVLTYIPKIHVPTYTTVRRRCVRCKQRCNYFCVLCGSKFMCFAEGCWELNHTPRT